jgi:site-specific recombinase XerD
VEACAADPTVAGVRDTAILAALYVGGVRRAELAGLALWGDRPGGLFLAITRHRKIVGDGMTSHAVYNVLAKRQAQAGVPKLSPHDFRRTFVGDLLDAGVDLSTVQQLAGHASVTTTARDDRRGEAAKRRAVEVLHFPYGGRPPAGERRSRGPE